MRFLIEMLYMLELRVVQNAQVFYGERAMKGRRTTYVGQCRSSTGGYLFKSGRTNERSDGGTRVNNVIKAFTFAANYVK